MWKKKQKEKPKKIKDEEFPYRIFLSLGSGYGGFSFERPETVEETEKLVAALKRINLNFKMENLPLEYEYRPVGIMYILQKKEELNEGTHSKTN